MDINFTQTVMVVIGPQLTVGYALKAQTIVHPKMTTMVYYRR